ncbi:hypothetical protein FRC10_001559, partial [Ceratobasidium sp. 414]
MAELKMRDEEKPAGKPENDEPMPWTLFTDYLDHRRTLRRMVLYYRAFTVKDHVDFQLDNLPRNPSFNHYFNLDDLHLPVPDKYLTAISYWPDPPFNVEEVNMRHQLDPLTLDLEG